MYHQSTSFLSLLLLFFIIATTTTTTTSAFSGPYCLNVRVDVKPDQRQAFLDAITNDGKQAIATEPNALQYVIGEDTETPNRFYLHEQYKTKADFEFHQTTEHYKQWKEFGATNDPWAEGTTPIVQFYQGSHKERKVPIRPAFCLNVELCIKPEVRDKFIRVIENNQKGSNEEEPLCLQYDWGESATDPNTFYFHEQYAGAEDGKEGFDAHASAPHFLAWEEFAATDPFTSPPVVSFYKSIEF